MKPEATPAASPQALPPEARPGLVHAPDGGWGRLRVSRVSSVAIVAVTRLMAHAIGALTVAQIYYRTVDTLLLIGWLAALAAIVCRGAMFEWSMIDAERRASGTGRRTQAIASAAVAIMWAVPILAFGPMGSAIDRLTLWTVLSMLVAASAMAATAVPLASLLFIGIVGGAAFGSFVTLADFQTAGIVGVFLVIVTMGVIERARASPVAQTAELAESESETTEPVALPPSRLDHGNSEWFWRTDALRRVRDVGARFASALGLERDDIANRPFMEVIAGGSWETGEFHSGLHELAQRFKRRESFSNLLVRLSAGGEHRWLELTGTPKFDESGAFDGFEGAASDVTEQRESSDKIAFLARYDTLTGLPNRLQLTEALGAAMQYAEHWRTRCAFLMIDLDRFKEINDTLGHVVGDQLLQRVAERLKALLGEHELVGRLGGDEFAIVIRDASEGARVATVARQVIDTLSEPYEVDQHTLYVGASVGSALGPRDGLTVETLMRSADLALYRAKDEGGARHFAYEPSLHAHAEERRKLEFSLRRALERNELEVVYQPVVDAVEETVVGFEALARWHSAEHGLVAPAKFIPLAEETRLILPIGEWILRQACREATNWPSDVRVAVNVSGEQLLEPQFAATVVSALSSSGLPADRLEIEITESIFVRDGTAAHQTLQRLMGLGCTIALDDFGTGYSSLGYLRKIRFSTIKVDRSFVQGAAKRSAESLAIIRAVVAMADSLGMSTTAEGVETQEELDTARRLGCKKIQGYYFSKPLSAADALRLFPRASLREQGAAA